MALFSVFKYYFSAVHYCKLDLSLYLPTLGTWGDFSVLLDCLLTFQITVS